MCVQKRHLVSTKKLRAKINLQFFPRRDKSFNASTKALSLRVVMTYSQIASSC